MKKIYYILLLFLLCIPAGYAQTDNSRNYVKTTVYTDSTATNGLTTVGYLDGLGRPVQTVQKAISPTQKDVVTALEYDDAGRDYRHWLPTPTANNTGDYVANYSSLAATVYGQPEAYSQSFYEPSPLNRVSSQRGPGTAWNNHPIVIQYGTNTASEVIQFGVTNDNKLQKTGYYSAQTLTKTTSADEDGKQTCEYKDMLGRVLLRRAIAEAGNHDTYFVYNDLGQMCFVLSPEASDLLSSMSAPTAPTNDNPLGKLGYAYRYDPKGRCIVKKLPGCDSISMVYDQTDRLVMSQDGNQRAAGKWSFTKYDALGRAILTGEINLSTTAAALRTQYEDLLVKEDYIGNNNSVYGYSNTSQPQISAGDVLTANYYDDITRLTGLSGVPATLAYATKTGYASPYVSPVDPALSAKGLLVGTRVKHLDQTMTLYTALYYDDKGRIVQKRANNHLNGYDNEYYIYNFSGQPLKNLHEHVGVTSTVFTEEYTYAYDQAGRPTTTLYAFNGGTPVTLSSLEYNEPGQLKTKKLHNAKETINYTYNIRSWQKSISSQHFTENMYYNDNMPVNTNSYSNLSQAPCYNGNISALNWGGASESNNPQYFYTYDGLNRLKKGLCPTYGLNANEEVEEYDKNGNIKKLKRDGTAWVVEESFYSPEPFNDLQLEYNGNQLSKITDSAVKDDPAFTAIGETIYYPNTDFTDVNDPSQPTEYLYDANGNQTADLNKGIAWIRYNSLNLPEKIQFMNGNVSEYYYDAAGAKYKARYLTAPFPVQLPLGEVTDFDSESFYSEMNISETYYCGNFIYENGVLTKVLTPEGYLRISSTSAWGWVNGVYKVITTYTPEYNYFLRDHLGNTRAQLIPSGSTMAVVDSKNYYPFGQQHSADPCFEFFGYTNNATNPYLYNGKEMDRMHGLNWYDYGARWKDLGWTSVDPLCEKYYSVSPYAYCNDNPVRFIDPNGLAWKSTKNEKTGEQTGYEWIPDDQSYNKDGSLKDGLYDQAIFFSNNTNDGNDIGSSTAYVYLADGTSTTFDASTRPSDENNYPTTPAGIYEAKVGEHHGSSSSYPALKVRDIDATSQTIELGTSNPAHHDRTYAEGIDIHKAGKNNYTGTYIGKDGKVHGVSEGCLLIDKNNWNSFINIFNNSEQKSNIISVTVSRTLAQPTNTNVLQKTFAPQNIPANFTQKTDAVKVSIPFIR